MSKYLDDTEKISAKISQIRVIRIVQDLASSLDRVSAGYVTYPISLSY